MRTIWLSPNGYISGDPTLKISYPFMSHPGTVVTCTAADDYKWISIGLPLPSDVEIDEIIIGYAVSNPQSFISQIRLTEMGTPDHATVLYDQSMAPPLNSGPASLTSSVGGKAPTPGCAVSLALRLNFKNAIDEITLGAVGVALRSTRQRCVNSIAELRALEPGAVSCIEVLGYYASGDGGGGAFYWDASSTEADNGGTIIASAWNPAMGRWMRLIEGSLSVKWFGARADPQTNDSMAITAAINVIQKMGGGRLVFQPGSYFLGSRCGFSRVFEFTGLSNVVFEGNGAELYCSTTDQSQTYIFFLANPTNLTFNDLHFRDTGTQLDTDWRGAWAFWLLASGSSGYAGGILFHNCGGTSLVGLLGITGDSDYRIRNVTLINCRLSSAYYGINCQYNGDDLTAVNFRSENVRRVYFPYGVTNHNVDLSIYHDGNAPGSNGCVDIKRYTRDTSNIKVRAVFEGSGLKYGAYINLEHGPASCNGLIEDIDIEVHASRLDPNSGYIVRFCSLSADGTEETITTNNRWNRIRICGTFGTGGNSANPIYLVVKQLVEGTLCLDPEVTDTINLSRPHYPGFVVRTAHDREVRTIQGDLTTQNVVIPLVQLDANVIALRVSVYAHDDYTALALQNTTYSEDLIIGYNAGGGGAMSIQRMQNLSGTSIGIPVAISYIASGENLNVAFSGATYSKANAFARVEVQYIGLGPQY